jgi:hypothetical protein
MMKVIAMVMVMVMMMMMMLLLMICDPQTVEVLTRHKRSDCFRATSDPGAQPNWNGGTAYQ